jgi:hypothetical protein
VINELQTLKAAQPRVKLTCYAAEDGAQIVSFGYNKKKNPKLKRRLLNKLLGRKVQKKSKKEKR